jgi:hypothetical protein
MRRTLAAKSGTGFTLIEALLAAVVLAAVVTALVVPFAAGARIQQVEVRRFLAAGLAEQMMEEILRHPFEEPDDGDTEPEGESRFGPEPDERSRGDYDAIDDYDGHVEAAGVLTDAVGRAITDAGVAGLTRHVRVEYVYVTGQDASEHVPLLRVRVEVRHAGRTIITLTRLVHWLWQAAERDR